MWKYDNGTPCPAPIAKRRDFAHTLDGSKQTAASSLQSNNFTDYEDNTTQNIARLIQSEFKNSSPKRRQGLAQKPRRNVSVSIFEDKLHSANQPDARRTAESSRPARGAIGAKPARKIRLETVKESQPISAPVSSHEAPSLDDTLFDLDGPRRETSENIAREESRIGGGHATKESRRRSIWVPSEDTTVFTIHPGAYTHTLKDDTFCLSNSHDSNKPATTAVPSPAVMKPTKSSRHSMSVAPKRAPLASLAPVQANASLGDRAGSGGGKENIPPNTRLLQLKAEGKRLLKNTSPESPQEIAPRVLEVSQPARRSSVFMQPTATSQARHNPIKKRPMLDHKDDVRKAKVPVTKDPRPSTGSKYKLSDKFTDAQSSSPDVYQPKRAPTKFNISEVRSSVSANLSRYPVLPEDLDQPQLYEDNWLAHQEIALTQLVNGVLQRADDSSFLPHDNAANLRGELLKLYQDPVVATLHKRLKASLLYGALSLPKDATGPPRLTEDIGLRRQFLDLWMHSYDLDSLQAAAEAVVGRVITARPRDATTIAQSLGSNSGTPESPKAKELRRFLLAFLVHHEDAVDASMPQLKTIGARKSGEEAALKVGTPEWYWQRTVLHSLMLIHLLDTAKSTGTISSCLFQASSIRKSSISFLQAFARMLIPSVGDIIRPLGYLDYKPQHTQAPLSEYNYRIDNIAIDLRNGVLLTRFVELLLYTPSTLSAYQEDSTITLCLPDGETLTSMTTTPQVLTQHLKYPCPSGAQKKHNVQIALSALASTNDALITRATTNLSASDIVDGHREKTLSLLWALVSRWGMSALIDWDELASETNRFSSTLIHLPATNDQDPEAHLLSWARAICASQNVSITNLTTSFASSAALIAILTTYSPFLPSQPRTTTSSSPATLLRSLNCSSAFTTLFTTSHQIPSRNQTTALLAFLASRLLPLARVSRAAVTIQRVWRCKQQRFMAAVKSRMKGVAREAAQIVAAKEKIVGAVLVLQRAWRGVLGRRIEDLERDVRAFQGLARGWEVRRRMAGGAGGRVMGGW